MNRNKYLSQLQPGMLVTNAPWVTVSLPPLNLDAHWLPVGIWHLAQEDNGGNHNVYVDMLDGQGQPMEPATISDKLLCFSWEGRRPDEPAPPVKFDKRPPEPAANLPIWPGQKMIIWIEDGHPISNRAINLHTNLPDNPPGNTVGHHSYYVVFSAVSKPTPPEQALTLDERVRRLEVAQTVTDRRLDDLERRVGVLEAAG